MLLGPNSSGRQREKDLMKDALFNELIDLSGV